MDRQLDWALIEGQLKPVFKASLRTYKRKAPIGLFSDDDVLQEGRLALFRALKRYNSKEGSLENFAFGVLQRTYAMMLRKNTCSLRMPRKAVRDGSDWILVATFPKALDGVEVKSESLTPFQELQDKEKSELLEKLKKRVYDELSGRDKLVYECYMAPSFEFSNMVKRESGDATKVQIVHVEKFLNIGRWSIERSISKIKKTFRGMAKKEEFKDLIYA